VFAVVVLGAVVWELFSKADSMITVQRSSWKKCRGDKVGELYERRRHGKGAYIKDIS
jgi:hypothetical protein